MTLDFPTDLKGQLRQIRERAALLNLAIQGGRESGLIGDGFDGEALEATAGWISVVMTQICDSAGVDEVPVVRDA